MRRRIPYNLQFFAADNGGGDGAGSQQSTGDNGQQSGANNNAQNQGVDYDKIQQMLDTATAKKENAVLKSYFQQQGLSEEEVSQAIADFKSNKQQQSQRQQDDNVELQNQIAQANAQAEQANAQAEQAQIELEATKVAMALGIDSKTLPYVLKVADFSNIKDKDGKINADNVKAAINAVLEDVPAFKPQKETSKGFQIGGNGQSGQQSAPNTTQTVQNRWNRFNH